MTFDQPTDKLLGDLSFVLHASTTTGLPVRFTSNSADICTVNDRLVTLLAGGVCAVTAVLEGDTQGNPPAAVTHQIHVLLPEPDNTQKLFLPLVGQN